MRIDFKSLVPDHIPYYNRILTIFKNFDFRILSPHQFLSPVILRSYRALAIFWNRGLDCSSADCRSWFDGEDVRNSLY